MLIIELTILVLPDIFPYRWRCQTLSRIVPRPILAFRTRHSGPGILLGTNFEQTLNKILLKTDNVSLLLQDVSLVGFSLYWVKKLLTGPDIFVTLSVSDQ